MPYARLSCVVWKSALGSVVWFILMVALAFPRAKIACEMHGNSSGSTCWHPVFIDEDTELWVGYDSSSVVAVQLPAGSAQCLAPEPQQPPSPMQRGQPFFSAFLIPLAHVDRLPHSTQATYLSPSHSWGLSGGFTESPPFASPNTLPLRSHSRNCRESPVWALGYDWSI